MLKQLGACFVLFLYLSFISTSAASNSSSSSPLKFLIFTEECFTILTSGDLFNVPCLTKALSKLLSYAIIAGAFVLKVPQILKILQAGDVTGLSPISFYLETLSFTTGVSYNIIQGYPFSSYGEAIVILAQNYLLIVMLWNYSGRPNYLSRLLITLTYVGLTYSMFLLPQLEPTVRANIPALNKMLLSPLHTILPTVGIATTIASRVPQIYTNYSNGHTGQMALITWVLNMGGSLARVFTTLQEVNDAIILSGYIIGASLSSVLVFQIIYFWKTTDKALATQKIKKQT